MGAFVSGGEAVSAQRPALMLDLSRHQFRGQTGPAAPHFGIANHVFEGNVKHYVSVSENIYSGDPGFGALLVRRLLPGLGLAPTTRRR
jgi:hypothetical protein